MKASNVPLLIHMEIILIIVNVVFLLDVDIMLC